MRLTFATYNIHYGIGRDGVTDIDRIVDTVSAADVICLQEVTQHFRGPEDPDNVAELSKRLNYYYVFGAGVDVDASTVDDAGATRAICSCSSPALPAQAGRCTRKRVRRISQRSKRRRTSVTLAAGRTAILTEMVRWNSQTS